MPMGIPLRADLARYLAITVCCSALSSPALAAGAVAVADEPDGPGWVVEISVRETDASAAKATALKGCRKRTVENKFDPDFCEIVSEFTNRCAAASMNPDGPGEAWAVADTLEEARKLALNKCAALAGGAKSKCSAAFSECDTDSQRGKTVDKSGKGRPRANTPR
jgi:hypothetical protein